MQWGFADQLDGRQRGSGRQWRAQVGGSAGASGGVSAGGHGSITAAANALAAAALKSGLTAELVGCTDPTNMAHASKLSTMALAGYGAVVLLANSGEPFGYTATTEIQNLVDYVKAGGALIAIEDADHCYDGACDGHPASQPYEDLVGNDFVGHPGDVSLATCTKMGAGPSIDKLPATFTATDAIRQRQLALVLGQQLIPSVGHRGAHELHPPGGRIRQRRKRGRDGQSIHLLATAQRLGPDCCS